MLSQNILIQTGNALSLNDPKTKPTQDPTDDLVDTLKIVLRDNESIGENPVIGKEDNTLDSINRKDVKITVKLFISSPEVDLLKAAVDRVCKALHTNAIDSLIIAYWSKENSEDLLEVLKCLWKGVEEYVELGKLLSVGLSDVNTNVFIDLYEWASIKPNIVQISLAICCVVPPALQAFTTENEVQLLTHSDPGQILPQEKLNEILGNGVKLYWVTRYQIYVKCRGILSSKGYLLYINKATTNS